MSVSLQKGQKVNLSKDNAGLAKVIVGLGWDEAKPSGGGGGGFFATLFWRRCYNTSGNRLRCFCNHAERMENSWTEPI